MVYSTAVDRTITKSCTFSSFKKFLFKLSWLKKWRDNCNNIWNKFHCLQCLETYKRSNFSKPKPHFKKIVTLSCGRHHISREQQQNSSCLFVLLEVESWPGQDPTVNIIYLKSYLKQKYMCNYHTVVKLN